AMSAQSRGATREKVMSRRPATLEIGADLPFPKVSSVLDEANPWLGYGHIPAVLRERCGALAAQFGAAAFSDYLALLLLTLMEDFERRFARIGLPDIFAAQFLASFVRIEKDIAAGANYSLDDDIFL